MLSPSSLPTSCWIGVPLTDYASQEDIRAGDVVHAQRDSVAVAEIKFRASSDHPVFMDSRDKPGHDDRYYKSIS